MSKKLPLGSGIARAKRNRHRPRGTPCSECGQALEQVVDCTCVKRRDRAAFLGMAELRKVRPAAKPLRKHRLERSALRVPPSAQTSSAKGAS